MSTETDTKPDTDTIGQWPPVAHIIRKADDQTKRALCGAKLMGELLHDNVLKATCEECTEIMERELWGNKQ